MPLTTTLRHINLETGDEQVTQQGQVADARVRMLTPLSEYIAIRTNCGCL